MTIYSKAELVALGADAILAMDLPETDPNFSVSRRALWQIASNDAKRSRQAVAVTEPGPATVEAVEEGPAPDPRDEEIAALRARVEELEARDTSVFADAPLFPAPDALMSDWGEVGTYPGVPDDFVQLMTGDETLEQAVERMTLGVDELLDMATVLSDPSLELALCTVPPERVNEWTEKLITEKARLRRLRGTVDENFGRENLVSRVQGMFAQVGAKR